MSWGRSCGPGICVSRSAFGLGLGLAPWGWFGPSGGVFLLALPERCLFVDSLSGFFFLFLVLSRLFIAALWSSLGSCW